MTATKVCPIVLRDREGVTQILAFLHPTAGCQLVKGTIQPGETAEDAAVRELREESGIDGAQVRLDLGLWEATHHNQIWSLHLCDVELDAIDQWSFNTEDGGGLVFKFFWHPLQTELPEPCHALFREALNEIRGRLARHGIGHGSTSTPESKC
jgi:8-oxo-dGTP pyrophosphatase MutT (NUDIX family)